MEPEGILSAHKIHSPLLPHPRFAPALTPDGLRAVTSTVGKCVPDVTFCLELWLPGDLVLVLWTSVCICMSLFEVLPDSSLGCLNFIDKHVFTRVLVLEFLATWKVPAIHPCVKRKTCSGVKFLGSIFLSISWDLCKAESDRSFPP